MRKILPLMGAMMFLFGCSNDRLAVYNNTTPVMRFDQFFNGSLSGQAIVQNRRGDVIKTFTVDMVGHWQGDKGLLQEHFVYSDGKIQDRLWDVTKMADNHFEGTADDIIGKAVGRSNGNAIQWNYVMKVDVDDATYDISFDDWMFAMNDHMIINRSIMTKFGFRVGEITIAIQKNKSL